MEGEMAGIERDSRRRLLNLIQFGQAALEIEPVNMFLQCRL
jgi:hypothetical protein